jgi:transcriptional regulator with XRE-family HTH domain
LLQASSVSFNVTEGFAQFRHNQIMSGSRALERPLSDRPPHRVKALRVARGWSMDDLASRANTSRQRIWAIERGNTRLNEDWLRKLAAAFDVAPTELLPDEDQSLVLSPEERELIAMIRALPAERRALLSGILSGLNAPVAA